MKFNYSNLSFLKSIRKCLIIIFTISFTFVLLSKTTNANEINVNIDLNESYSLHCIKIKANLKEFYPSHFGGVSVIGSKGEQFYPWSYWN